MNDITNKVYLGGSDLPDLAQFAGVWAIQPEAIETAVETLNGLNLRDHVTMSRAFRMPNTRYTSAAYPVIATDVAVLQILGPITKGGSSLGGASSVALRRQVRHAADDDRIRAILFIIDSPGGTVAGAHDLADDVAAATKKKPTTAFCEDLAASAAFLVASQCRQIFATKTTIIGAIGTYMIITDRSKMAEKIGLKVHVVRTGEFKGAGTPGTKITSEQLAEWQRRVDAINEQFIAAVARGRRMSIDKVRTLGDGRVHVGQEAVKLGLVDGIKTFDEVVNLVAKSSTAHEELEMGQTANQAQQDQPATLDQLRENCPAASSDFFLSMIEREATVEDAKGEFIRHQQDHLAIEKAKAEARGVQPLPTGFSKNSSAGHGDAESQWNELVAEKVAAGMTKQKAVMAVARENPELREAYVEEHNERYGRV